MSVINKHLDGDKKKSPFFLYNEKICLDLYSKEFNMRKLLTIYGIIIAALIIGEIRCIYKALTCNWEPIGKAEVIYTASSLTGLGCVVGWFNIEDK